MRRALITVLIGMLTLGSIAQNLSSTPANHGSTKSSTEAGMAPAKRHTSHHRRSEKKAVSQKHECKTHAPASTPSK